MIGAEHTPGDWEAIPPEKKGRHWTVGARGPFGGVPVLWTVATVGNGAPGDTLETEAANARLLAAAPDLLAACESIAANAVGGGEVLDRIRAAVAKARGVRPEARPC